MLQAELDGELHGGGRDRLVLNLSLAELGEAGAALNPGFRDVLPGEAEDLVCEVLLHRVQELVDHGRDLQAALQDDLLALEPDVLRPSDETCQVLHGLGGLAEDVRLLGRLAERLLDIGVLVRLGCVGGLSDHQTFL